MNSALVRPAGDGSSGDMRESASFTAHLKTLERKVPLRGRYENFIGGKWVSPVKGAYFDNISPTTGQVICQIPRSQAEDVELALDAAHAAAGSWGRTPVADRARILNRIADRLEQYLPFLAAVETYDNGKPIRETNLADMPLAVDHFRYFASCVRAQEGSLGELDEDTVAYHYHEPLGVVGQIIPWNFPILMAAWKLAPALAAGNAVVIKPAEQTPMSLLVLAELIQDILPPGVLNVVNGHVSESNESIHFLGVCGAQLLDHFAETRARPLPGGYSWQSEQDSPQRAESGCVAPPGNGYSPPPGSAQKWRSPFAFPALSAAILRRTIAARMRAAGLSSERITTTVRALKTRDPQLGAAVEETHLTFQSEAIGNIYPSSILPFH
jgi:hypothetical protein